MLTGGNGDLAKGITSIRRGVGQDHMTRLGKGRFDDHAFAGRQHHTVHLRFVFIAPAIATDPFQPHTGQT